MQDSTAAQAFIEQWQGVEASELASAQSFVLGLCALLGVDAPHPSPEQNYMFERPVTFVHGDGSTSAGRIDCYKRGHFVLEAKKLKAGPSSRSYGEGLLRARTQGENYARALPAAEGRPPFVLALDVGAAIEVYAEFSRSGGTYTPFPDPRSHRILLADLARPEVLERLRLIWTDPDALNPARIAAKVTRAVSEQLARLARSLEQSGYAPPCVAAYLSRCLFSMFAEDVELLPKGAFQTLLLQHRAQPATLQQMLRILWADMDRGGFSAALTQPVLHFNGKLFKGAQSDGYSLLLNSEQIDLLLQAASANWREVEPAIFGTLLERALDPSERHALGAHYTPRAYVERLVLPTVIEPLRAEWANAQGAALLLAREAAALQAQPPAPKTQADFAGLSAPERAALNQRHRDERDKHQSAVRAKWAEARAPLHAYLHRLCTLRVLDPACGSGNFLYVTLEHLKRLEGEVRNQLHALGDSQDALDLGRETVTLQQLLGIELNERAAALAELVLWIGFLQWHMRSQGRAAVIEPVVHDYGNIQHRDALLAYAGQEPMTDVHGQPLMRWDGTSTKTHPATGQAVPDESAQVLQWRYLQPRAAAWPQADFIVGNPPFIGNKRLRVALGDGYVQALRQAWPEVPESADFVMYWWHHAAALVRAGQAERFGFITTNSLTMIFNRRVTEAHLNADPPLGLIYAVPDHPWVDSSDGAAVRIAMTVGVRGATEGRLQVVTDECEDANGEVAVDLATHPGRIHADLRVGPNVAAAVRLKANDRISNRGVIPHGAGFILNRDEAQRLGLGTTPGLEQHIRPYRNGRDLTATARDALVIDLFGLSSDEVRQRYPAVFQWLLERVKPDRDQNKEPSRRENWWLFARPNTELREALAGLPRYIVTGQVAKHRVFQCLDAAILPDDKLIAIASADALHLGVLSSVVHGVWALSTGGSLEDRPVYSKSTCFETFPFPDADTGLTPALAARIRALAEQIDAQRKARLAAHPELTLTALYNVLERLRCGVRLNAKEQRTHELGLVGVLQSLHDELDAAVLQAYAWADLQPALSALHASLASANVAAAAASGTAGAAARNTLLERLVALNAQRAAEEASGRVRWLRPAFQQAGRGVQAALDIPTRAETDLPARSAGPDAALPYTPECRPWPASATEQIKAVADVLARAGRSLDIDGVAAHFSGRGRWRERLPSLLETLVDLGRARLLAGRWVDAGR